MFLNSLLQHGRSNSKIDENWKKKLREKREMGNWEREKE